MYCICAYRIIYLNYLILELYDTLIMSYVVIIKDKDHSESVALAVAEINARFCGLWWIYDKNEWGFKTNSWPCTIMFIGFS